MNQKKKKNSKSLYKDISLNSRIKKKKKEQKKVESSGEKARDILPKTKYQTSSNPPLFILIF
jgi:hypothetical protein